MLSGSGNLATSYFNSSDEKPVISKRPIIVVDEKQSRREYTNLVGPEVKRGKSNRPMTVYN